MSPRLVAVLAGAALLALVATTSGLAVQWQRADTATDRAERLAAEVGRLEDEVERLEDRLAARDEDDDADGEGARAGDLDGLLDGLLADDGGLGDLLGGAGAGCLGADGGVLDGLLGGEEVSRPEEPDELVEVVGEEVAGLRDLAWREPVEVDFVDGAELGQRLDEVLAEDLDAEAVDAEQRLLTALGAIPPGTDLASLHRELLDDQVAGYYDPDTGELVVRVPDDGRIGALHQVTLAHELEHALADQVLGLPDLVHDADLEDADAQLGALAVVEGGATLLMQQWTLEHLPLSDQLGGLLDGDVAGAQAALGEVPHHLQRELLFPYTEGLGYVCELYLAGGWEAVDARVEDPPRTSLEVLVPERDGQAPADPPALEAPRDGRSLLDTTFGAAPLLWLLEAPGGERSAGLADARDHASAWAGGTAQVWDLDGQTAVGLALVDRTGREVLCEAMATWHARAFDEHEAGRDRAVRVFRGEDRSAALRCEEGDVRYASAPALATALRIVTDTGP